MGLGKTLEGLLIDDELRRRSDEASDGYNHPAYKRPTLIVAPPGTHEDAWVDHILRLHGWDYPSSLIEVIDRKNRAKLSRRLQQRPLPAFVIVHYEALRLMPELAEIAWFHVICDEVHRVKNRAAQQTQALKKIPTFYKTGLSGTPGDDKPQDIWSVLNWLYPKEFRSYWKFVNRYCISESDINRGTGKTFRRFTDVNKQTIGELHDIWEPWYIRRRKDDVGIDLPPKYYTEIHVDLLLGQRKAYDQMRKDMIAWIGEHEDEPLVAGQVVTQLVRLQQFALATVSFREDGRIKLIDPSSKLDRLEELIDGNPNESIVVFSQSRSMVDLCVRRLRARGITVVPYTGTVSAAYRTMALKQFQAGNVQVFAGTIAAGGEGITLHKSSTVAFLDRSWNPTKNVQAEDRLHRIGQEHPVQVIDFVARDTVDRGRLQRIASKWENIRWLLGDIKAEAVQVGG
jgi:SNF2 family DNA or RNA helicase